MNKLKRYLLMTDSVFPKVVSVLLAMMMVIIMITSAVIAEPAETAGGAGEAVSEEPVLYCVKSETSSGGTVTLTDAYGMPADDGGSEADRTLYYAAGEMVYFTALPDADYQLDELKVLDGYGNPVAYTTGVVSCFIMPASDILITPAFSKIPLSDEINTEASVPEISTDSLVMDPSGEDAFYGLASGNDAQDNSGEEAAAQEDAEVENPGEGTAAPVSAEAEISGEEAAVQAGAVEEIPADKAPVEETAVLEDAKAETPAAETPADETPVSETLDLDKASEEDAQEIIPEIEDSPIPPLTEKDSSQENTDEYGTDDAANNNEEGSDAAAEEVSDGAASEMVLSGEDSEKPNEINSEEKENEESINKENTNKENVNKGNETDNDNGSEEPVIPPETEKNQEQGSLNEKESYHEQEETDGRRSSVDATDLQDVPLSSEETGRGFVHPEDENAEIVTGTNEALITAESEVKDPYYIRSDFDYSPYYGLDFSSMRLMVGTHDPSIFVDETVVISELNGLYLLQFEDIGTALKAYAFYSRLAELVEIDNRALAVNDDAFLNGEIMTEQDNPFQQAQQAIYETGYSNDYDIALIDTGANENVTGAVSVIGEYAGDDNGHGTLMASYMREQNPDARILSIKAFESDGTADLSAIYAAFQYAITQNVKIISISASAFASADSEVLRSVVYGAAASGITIVSSAGNGGRDAGWYVPGGYDCVLTIGACDDQGVRIPSSNYGACVNYNVAADSTSEAAAKFSGYYSTFHQGEEFILKPGLIFYPDQTAPEMDVLSDHDLTRLTKEEIIELVESLDPEGKQLLWNDLSDEEMRHLEDVFGCFDAEYMFDWDICYTQILALFEITPVEFYIDASREYIYQTNYGSTDLELFLTGDGDIAYCLELRIPGPRGVVAYDRSGYASPTICYILYNGYPRNTTINGIAYTEEQARIVTQLALWIYCHNGFAYMEDAYQWLYDRWAAIGGEWAGLLRFLDEACVYIMSCLSYDGSNSTINRYAQLWTTTETDYTHMEDYYVGYNLQTMVSVTPFGSLNVRKVSSDPDKTNGNSHYSLAGAVYGVYSDEGCTNLVETLTTDENGQTGTVELEAGLVYHIKEITPSPGFTLDINVHHVTIEEHQTKTVESAEVPEERKGSLYIQKHSSKPEMTNGNDHYSLAGAVYGVYSNEGCTNLLKTLTTDENGRTGTVELEAGLVYHIKEITPSPGFTLDITVHHVTVEEHQTKKVDSSEVPEERKGALYIQKHSSKPEMTNENDHYSLAGAVYGVYSDEGCTNLLKTLTTDESGRTGTVELEAGLVYHIKEITPSPGFTLDITVHHVTVEEHQTKKVDSSEVPEKREGYLYVQKYSSKPAMTNGNDQYSLAGAVYEVFRDSACSDLAATLTTDADGKTDTVCLEEGIYYIREKTASRGYKVNGTLETKTVAANTTAMVSSMEEPGEGHVSLSKVSAIPEGTDINSCYSLEGAVYGIYTNAACTQTCEYTRAVTGAGGTFTVTRMPFGTYYVKEITPSSGFGLDQEVYTLHLTPGHPAGTVTSTEPVKGIPIEVLVQKTDKETGQNIPQGAASMQGAEYTVKYYANYGWSGNPSRTWVLVTDQQGKVILNDSSLKPGSDSLFQTPEGKYYIPSGSFQIQETKAPAGYKTDPAIYSYKVSGSEIAYTGNSRSLIPISTYPVLDIQKGVSSEEEVLAGGIQVTKLIKDTSDAYDGNASAAGIRFAIVLSGEKNQKDVYVPADGGTKYRPGQVVTVITTNTSGIAATGKKDLPYGYYDVYELSRDSSVRAGSVWTSQEPAESGKLANDTGIVYNALHTRLFVNAYNVYQTWSVSNDISYGYIKITKNDADRNQNQPQGDASLDGIRFAIVNRSVNKVFYPAGSSNGTLILPGSVVDILTTDARGEAVSGKLPYGNYDVIELRLDSAVTRGTPWILNGSSVYASQKGYLYTAMTKNVTINTYNKTIQESFSDYPVRGGVKVQKILEELNAAEIQGGASLAGVTFHVVNASNTDVYVNGSWYSSIPDKGTNGSSAVSMASVAGTGYTREQLLAAVADHNVVAATMTTDESGAAELGPDTLPYGTYYIYEASSNASMMINDWVLRIEIRENKKVLDACAFPSQNPIVRGDLSFSKVNIDGMIRGNVPFLILAYDAKGNAVEGHVIVTDSSGHANTALRDNTNHTNGMDAYVAYDQATGAYYMNEDGEALLSSGEAASYGIWFSGGMNPSTGEMTGNTAKAVNNRGALYYGNYRIFEIQCRDNSGKGEDLLKSPVISIGTDTTAKSVSFDRFGHIIKESSDRLLQYRSFVDLEVGLTTLALDENSGSHVTSVKENNVLSDQIHYTHLKTSSVYKWVINFVQKDNPVNVLSEIVVDGYVPGKSSPNLETAEGSFKVLTDGTITGDFQADHQPTVISTGNVDARSLEGSEIAAVVYLYQYTEGYDFTAADKVKACDFILSHNTELSDVQEIIYIPSMKTLAKDSLTGDHAGAKQTKGGILDSVTMTNLGSREHYMLVETVVDKASGEPLEGLEPAARSFYSGRTEPRVPSMTVEMPLLALDSSVFGERTLVVCEELWRIDSHGNKLDDCPVITHESLLDEDQSIHYMEIDTHVTDTGTGDRVGHTSDEAGETTCIQDQVALSNLVPGLEYTVRGQLVYQQGGTDTDGKAHKAGEKLKMLEGSETEQTFIAESEKETVTIAYVVDTSALGGLSLVSEAYAYHNEVLIASHTDLEDEEQTICFPKIETTLQDSKDNDQEDAFAEGLIELVDTVSYENLIPGLSYTLNAQLFLKETEQEAIDDEGRKMTGTVTFVPESSDGTVAVSFSFPGKKLAGYSMVAFETLVHEGVDVARHHDIQDEAQTIHLPGIRTHLEDGTDQNAMGSEETGTLEIRLTDRVTFENLVEGREYMLTGTLYDKETGAPVLDDQGHEITAKTVFTAEARNGSAEVEFVFFGAGLAGKSVVAFEELYRDEKLVAIHADLDDEDQTVDFPRIATTLSDTVDSGPDAYGTNVVRLMDTVTYENLRPEQRYVVKGILYDRNTGNAALDDQGHEITSEVSFTPAQRNGTINLVFEFSGVSLAGSTLVAFEELYHDGRKIAVHADLSDEAQTSFIPAIHTSLKDAADGEHDVPEGMVTLIDTVEYQNLIAGDDYKVSGRLIDPETGEPLTGENGQEISTEKIFTADASRGTVDLEFTLSISGTGGKNIVAYERLYRKTGHGDGTEKLVASHEDLEDENQTVYIPAITTELKDSQDGSSDALASGKIVLIDTVTFQNLLPGKTYTVTGRLYDKETGKPALDDDGQEIISETVFETTEPNGTAEVVFTFRGVKLAGRSVVAFEDLYRNGKHVAFHADLDDSDQTVDIPQIRTSLADTIGDDKDALAGKEIVLKDTVHYSNVIPGKEYMAEGILMNKKTGQAVLDDSGKMITAGIDFTPDQKDGSVEVEFKFSGTGLAGETVVAFETLYRDGKAVASHCDIEDLDQMLYVPGIETSLKDSLDLEHDAYPIEKIVLTDTVRYHNLIPEMSYHVTGMLYDKETGKPLLDDQGKEISAEYSFRPEKPSGSVDVTFSFCGALLAGRSVVAFEHLYREDKHVAVHADIHDEEQTVHFPAIRTTLTDLETRLHNALAADPVVLTDLITYENLIPGKTYRLRGVLMNKETGEEVTAQDGTACRAEGTFTAQASSGTASISFICDNLPREGITVTAFETLYSSNGSKKEKELASHKDLNDEDQTVCVPSIRTRLTGEGEQKIIKECGTVKLFDTVTFENLYPGHVYTVTGRLMNKETGKPFTDADGKVLEAGTSFTPDSSSGSITVEFVYQSPEKMCRHLTAFEYLTENGALIAAHEDLDDEDQTVTVLSLRTMASFRNGTNQAFYDQNQIIVDKISYSGLVPGTYTIRTTLMKKKDGNPVTSNKKPLTSTATVELKETSGVVSVGIRVPAGTILGEVVVFEEMIHKSPDGKEVIVGEHKDLNDRSQMVTFYTDGKKDDSGTSRRHSPVRTGDENNTLVWAVTALFALVLMGLCAVYLIRHKRKNR